MATIVDAYVMEVTGRGRICTATLDEYPNVRNWKCTIGGEPFDYLLIHIRWKNPEDMKPVLGFKLGERELPSEWFIGKEVEPI